MFAALDDAGLNKSIFGELEKSGRIIRDVNICAATGLKISSGDAMVPIGEKHFFRVKAPLNRRHDTLSEIEEMYREQMGLDPK